MNQFIYVLLAAAAMYFVLVVIPKTTIALTTASVSIGGLKVPALPGILFTGLLGLIGWVLFDAFGIRLASAFAVIAIQSLAFYSMKSGEASSGGAFMWLIKAFVLGGLFMASLTLLATPPTI